MAANSIMPAPLPRSRGQCQTADFFCQSAAKEVHNTVASLSLMSKAAQIRR